MSEYEHSLRINAAPADIFRFVADVRNLPEYLSNQPCQDTLHFLDAHIDILDHTSVKHTRWHVPVTTVLLQFGQAL